MKRGHVLVVDDDADIRGLAQGAARAPGLRRHRGGQRASDGAAGALRVAARRRAPRRLDARARRLADAGADPRPLRRARGDADGPRRRAREGARAEGGRGRLHHEAVRPAGAPRPRRGDAPARRARARTRSETYADALLQVDFAQRRVAVNGDEVALTPLEFRLLAAFVRHPGQLLSHDQLLELVWGDSFSASRDQVKLYVGYLRRKLEGAGADAAPIETVRGFGYRYRPRRRPERARRAPAG